MNNLLRVLLLILFQIGILGYNTFNINNNIKNVFSKRIYNDQYYHHHQQQQYSNQKLYAVSSSSSLSPSSSPISVTTSIPSYKISSTTKGEIDKIIENKNNNNNSNNNINSNVNSIVISSANDMPSTSIEENELSVGPNALPPRPPNPFKRLFLLATTTFFLFFKVIIESVQLAGLKAMMTVTKTIIGMFHLITRNLLKSDIKNDDKKKKSNLLKELDSFVKKYYFLLLPVGLTMCLISFNLLTTLKNPKSITLEVSFASFLKLLSVAPSRIGNLRVTTNSFIYLVDGKRAITRIVNLEPNIMDKLMAAGIDFAAPPSPTNYFGIIWTFAYAAFLWNITSRMMQGPQDEGAGKRKDQGDLGKYGKLSFEDVAGQEKAKLEVKEVCDILKAPEKYTAVGARLPAGVLLVGPPGTGKTLLARVTAAEAGVPFYSCSASDFVEIFVGRGPARVRKLFTQAAKNAPCIVFIDELDSIGRSRRLGSMNSEQENTLNQLLTCMDGLDTSNNGVIVMAATNRFELLDPALLRAGRFDRIVQCPLPDKIGRLAILNVSTKKLNLSREVDLDRVARLTPGTCGADLCAIVNEAAIRTVRRGATVINSDDFEDALKSFFSTRGVQLAGLAEAAGFQIPEWLKKIAGQQQQQDNPNQQAPTIN
jgi:AAA+ superfamily predicted ATPase